MKTRDYILYTILYIIWLTVVFITGMHHEPWADEAQSWLIARDTGYIDMILHVLKYEGHPALFYFILRTLYLLKFPYSALYLVSFVFSAAGVFLFLYRTNVPLIIKSLFPFTYYLCYQYSIVSRSYCLFFPVLMFIAVIYKNRVNKPFIYSFLLVMLLSTSVYGFVLSFLLFVFFIYDIYKQKNFNIKSVSATILTFIFFILTALYIKTPVDCISYEPFILSVKNFISVFINAYSNDTESSTVDLKILILAMLMYVSAILIFCKNIYQRLFFLCVNFSVILILSSLVCRCWHYGHIIITFVFSIAVLSSENSENHTNRIVSNTFNTVFVFLALLQIQWSIIAVTTDLKNDYSNAKKMHEFIISNNLDKYDISGLGYLSVSLQPYFTHNIYKNYKTTHFMFKDDFWKYNYDAAIPLTPVIVYDSSWHLRFADILDDIDKNYDIYTFKNNITCKGNVNKEVYLYLLVSKNCNITN